MNISAVAKRAGVSKATVSRVLNGTAQVAPETASRVREAVEALDYHPDVNARTLGSGRSHLYGLIISDITNPYFPELVKAFEDIAMEHGQDVLISNTDYDPKRMARCVTRMLQRKVDGVAVMTSELEEHLLQRLRARQIPTIFMDTCSEVPGVSTVTIDYEHGIHLAMEHLVAQGHTRIAFLSGPLTLHSARRRLEAFQHELAAHKLPSPAHWVERGDHRIEGGHRAMLRLLDAGPRPTAVIASNDLTAIGAILAVHQRGLSIPRDLSLIGFDNIELSAFTQPALTTVQISRRDLADTAFRSLYGRREQTTPETQTGAEHVIRPTLLVRHSTAAPLPAEPSLS